ncbi:putative F-box protein At5g55150 [Malus sylvestris]|uniref:putative F-box protein At5g55150 n=1 Tax=Malus sylvestris TaxID=3752 RepID=UPI0021AD30D1|nr:putative F-box protein At5g55150 [Malus sylvestris]
MFGKVYHRRHIKRRTISPNWSDLRSEILELIMKNLSFLDMLRFKSVCSSWNQAMKCYYATSFPQTSPWLMLPSDQENVHNDIRTRCFYSLKEDEVYTVKNVLQECHDDWCVGSSHGWLVIMDNNAVPHLLNPVSRRRIQLPKIWSLQNCPSNPDSIEQLRMTFICKAVLSSDPSCNGNFVVVIIYGVLSSKLGFCKYGEEGSRWRGLEGVHGEYCDVIFHKEKLYALAGDGSVEVWRDFNNSSTPIKTMNLHQPYSELENVNHIIKDFSKDKYSTQTYLVESLGEILSVGRVIGNFVNHEGTAVLEGDLDEYGYFCPYRTLQFYVLKLNFTANKWEKIESLRGRALFLGGNQSMSVSTPDFLECEENSIYFTDDRWDEINFNAGSVDDNGYGGHDVGIYNIGNKVVKPIYQFEKWRVDPPPFWIVPNPW